MGCCGQGRKPAKPNGRVCPKCGFVMNRIHKFSPVTKSMLRYWACPNKAGRNSQPCGYREDIK